jgi:hypothetical protein
MIRSVSFLPHFETEDEMVSWFETADLSEYELHEALNMVIASRHREGDEPRAGAQKLSPSPPGSAL